MATILDIPLIAYPTLSRTAGFLGVSPSTISRRGDVAVELMGARDKRVTAAEVLRLAAIYRKRSINEVALDLVEYAREHAPAQASAVEEEVERFFDELPPPVLNARDFLADLKLAVPDAVYRQVERIYHASDTRPVSIVAVEHDEH
jgi:hypothetical protein